MRMLSNTFARRAPRLALVCVALVAGLLFAATPAFAKSYTVRIFGGNHGAYGGADPYVTEVPAGTDFVPNVNAVQIEGDKYYCQGFRLSGADDLTATYYINQDTDIVVAYGVPGKMVNYTLHFVEYNNNSNVLAEPRTFQGKVGDKPVAAYEYIPGWRPVYRQITGTLQDGANDWTFEYVRVEEGEEEPAAPTTTTTTEEGGTTTTTTTTTGTGTTTVTTPGDAADATTPATPTGGTEGTEGTTGDEGGAEGTDENGNPPTQEILDLDNPLAGGDQAGDTGAGTNEAAARTGINPITVGLIVAAATALGLLILFFTRRKKKDEEEATEPSAKE